MRAHSIGFGSQGSAWAQCLRASGFDVSVFLERRESATFQAAADQGFAPGLTSEIADKIAAAAPADGRPAPVALLVPDHLIATIYRERLARCERPLLLVLAHGYAVYSGAMNHLRPQHRCALLAPKAIGPKLLAAFNESRPNAHRLVAAFNAPSDPAATGVMSELARGLGFATERLVTATFDQETIGDLISEQTLLCGGVFNLIDWTVQEMTKAGVPAALIREECLTELELIAGMIRERGPSETLARISQAAQCGTTSMRARLIEAGVPGVIAKAAADVVDRSFVAEMERPEWKTEIAALRRRLETKS